jgi:4'-phosphopantetheinyl transferase
LTRFYIYRNQLDAEVQGINIRLNQLGWEAAFVRCATGEVHIWRIDLISTAISLKTLEATLSDEEREKANCFRSTQLRDRWVAARGALRHIVGSYVRSKPSSLVFQTGPYGKPYLSWPVVNIPFNLSHTASLALLAISSEGRVGVDAELIYPIAELEKISRRFFAAPEADEITALAPKARLAAFFACWTRKEAFVKALGNGLHIPIDRFRVTVRAEEPPRLVSVDWHEPSRWSMADVGEPSVAATIAVDGSAAVVRRFEFASGSVDLDAA